jgi:hypothetical protein
MKKKHELEKFITFRLVDSNIEEKLVATKTFEPGNSWVQLFEFADALQVEVNSCTVTLFNLFNKKVN